MLTDPKELPPPQRLRYIVEVMEMRARGREAIRAAARKRAKKASKRAVAVVNAPVMRKWLGEVDDADFGGFEPISSVPGFKEKLRAYVL